MTKLDRAAEALYLTDSTYQEDPLPWDQADQEKYKTMAASVLTTFLREPLDELV